MTERQARLRRRRPYARPLYASRVRARDVLHPAGNALVVLADGERVEDPRHGTRIRLRVTDEYATGETFERDLLLDPQREVLVSRKNLPRSG